MKLKAMLVDDEYPARGELRCLLAEIGGIDVVAECEDGDEALILLKNMDIDVVFLDIQMSTKDGLSTAGDIMKMPNPPWFVFTTGFSEFAVKAFDLNAVDYIVKPYSRKRLEQTVAKLWDMYDRTDDIATISEMTQYNARDWSPERIPVWANDRMIVLSYDEIFYANAVDKRKTELCTKSGKYITGFTLKEIGKRLVPPKFLRTHKSYIVNTEKIREVIPWFNNTYVLIFEGCTEKNIPVSRHYIKSFRDVMGI